MNLKALDDLIKRYEEEWDRYGMGSATSYSSVVSDLKKLREKLKQQQS